MTDVPLRDHFDVQLHAISDKIDGLRELMDEREKSATAALDLAQRTLNIRLEHMNEFREQVLSERAQFVSGEKIEAMIVPLATRLDVLQKQSQWRLGRDAVIGVVGMLIGTGLVTAVVAWMGQGP